MEGMSTSFTFPLRNGMTKTLIDTLEQDCVLSNRTQILDLSTPVRIGYVSPIKRPAASSWNRIGTVILSGANIGAVGGKCPVVVSVGQEPILTLLSGGSVYHCPNGVSEFEVAGYLQKSPYPVVKGPVTGIPIPATAEIAIEGYIPSPEEKLLPEGPFGEWTGYYGHGRRLETVIEVAAIHYRNGLYYFWLPAYSAHSSV